MEILLSTLLLLVVEEEVMEMVVEVVPEDIEQM
jgi:hypothetical protein